MFQQIWKGRGRPPSRSYSPKDEKIWESLARIAIRSKVDSSEFFNCILEAWNNNEAKCKQLSISCHKRMKGSAIFLFTNTQKVIAQFPIPTTILQGNNQIENYMRKKPRKKISSR